MIRTKFQRIYRELRKSWPTERSAFVAGKLASMGAGETSDLIEAVEA